MKKANGNIAIERDIASLRDFISRLEVKILLAENERQVNDFRKIIEHKKANIRRLQGLLQ
jgi:hypothetical protein